MTHCHLKDLCNSKKSCIFRVDEGGSVRIEREINLKISQKKLVYVDYFSYISSVK